MENGIIKKFSTLLFRQIKMQLSPHGLATHTEMALMQQAGLSSIAVLRAATINAAKAWVKNLKWDRWLLAITLI